MSWRSPVRGVWGGGGGGGPVVPGKGPGCKGGRDRCHALVTQGPHASWHKRDHILILPDIRQLPCVPLLCGIQPQKRKNNRQTPRLPPPQVPDDKTGPGKGWVPRMFWALHHLTMSYMELGFKTSWLNVPFIFNFFFNYYFFIVTKKIGTVQRKRKERRQEERQGGRQAS